MKKGNTQYSLRKLTSFIDQQSESMGVLCKIFNNIENIEQIAEKVNSVLPDKNISSRELRETNADDFQQSIEYQLVDNDPENGELEAAEGLLKSFLYTLEEELPASHRVRYYTFKQYDTLPFHNDENVFGYIVHDRDTKEALVFSGGRK